MTPMKAMVVRNLGGPEELILTEVPKPRPGPDEALINVKAVGICYHDVLDRAGKLPGTRAGRILGHEISGRIIELGDRVKSWSLNDRVVVYHRLFCGNCEHCLGERHDLCRNSRLIGSSADGGYAEYVCVPARNLVRLPDIIGWTSGALAVCPVGTGVRAVVGVAQVRSGNVVVVTGASGGLGLHQIQIAKSVGARVIAVSTSDNKTGAIRSVGADEVVSVRNLKFGEVVWRLTEKRGVDVVLDNVVTRTLAESLRCLGPRGIAVVLGNIGTESVELNPGLIVGRRLRIAGSGNATFRDVGKAMELLASGSVKAQIGRIMPFPRAGEAHALIETRAIVGRVVLSGW